MEKLTFDIPLRLISKDNFKCRSKSGFYFIPKRFKEFDSSLIAYVKKQLPDNFKIIDKNEIEVELRFGLAKKAGGIPDTGNAPKSVLDALNGVLWVDDRQIDYLLIKREKNAVFDYIQLSVTC